ncbi:MAG: molybdopterin oxidoreductase family protein [Promethearchaeota archaeon]
MRSITCGYCSTGCNLLYDDEGKGPFRISANPDYPVNLGKACVKGFQLLGHLNAPDRAKTPLLRNESGEFEPVNWDVALDEFVRQFKGIQGKHGLESVAFISTGQIPNEEHAFLGALAKFGMGIVHGDGNTRQCMATAVVAYKQSFGWDSPPFTYKDLEESDVLVFVGSNPVIAHPIIWNRVKMNKHGPEILVVDPRYTETAKQATRHYPIKVKSELLFFYAVAHLLDSNGWIDEVFIEEHTTGYASFREHIRKFNPDEYCESIGLPAEKIEEFARMIHQGKRVSFWWMVGINQSHQATRTAQAIINLALMTGNIGKPGTGANSITGQCNAMGARIFSNTTSLLGGYKFNSLEDREKVAGVLGMEPSLIPSKGSWSYEKILDGIDRGDVKGLWIICSNPAHSWISNTRIEGTFAKLDFLVVQDMYYTTETARMADLILPAAGTGEKGGTFVNSERRIGILQKAVDPPGEALPDFAIFQKIAHHWGCRDLFDEWRDPEAVFNIIKRLTRGKPWDITGIQGYAQLLECGGIQWPFPEGMDYPPPQERRLFSSGKFYHPDGKAIFLFDDYQEPPEEVDAEYPFILITGRGSVYQWHTQTRTLKSKLLAKHAPAEPYVEICEEDARTLGIEDGEWITVASRRASSKVRTKITGSVKSGELFMPMHYIETNRLTFPSFDEFSREPMYKYAAITIRKE